MNQAMENFVLSQVNWLSVVVATLVSFVIGSLWYSPLLFGKIWQAELKLSDEEIGKANMPLIFASSFVLSFIGALFLDMLIGEDASTGSGFLAGLIVGLAWIATSFGTNYLFARRSFKLYLIDAGYFVVLFPIMGVILGAW
jgi:hypothetical protein